MNNDGDLIYKWEEDSYIQIFDDYLNPVWNQLVDEVMIISYSMITHAWGD